MQVKDILFRAILWGSGLAILGVISPWHMHDDDLVLLWLAGFGGCLMLRLLQELQRLQREVADLRSRIGTGDGPSRATPPPLPQAAGKTAPETDAPPNPRPSWQTPPIANAARPTLAATNAAPSVPRRTLRGLLRLLARGNPLANAGIAILVIAAAFVLRYAAEAGVFPIRARLALVCAVGIALVLAGWWLRRRNAVYSWTLQGGGVALFYLTLFAGFRVYAVIDPGTAFAMLVATGIVAVTLAVLQNAMPLALIGVIGGFAAPLLVSSGDGDHVWLFGYYALLNLVVFGVAWFRSWWWLNLVGFLFTFGVLGVFRVAGYRHGMLWTTDPFVLLFFVMYWVVSILYALRQPPRLKGYVSSTLVFALPFAAFALHASLVQHIAHAVTLSAVLLSVFYFASAGLLRSRRAGYLALLGQAFMALGVIFGTLAVPLAFAPETTASMWAIEGAGLLWVGLRQSRRLAAWAGLLLQAVAALFYLQSMRPDLGLTPVINANFLGALMLALGGLASSVFLRKPQTLFKAAMPVDVVAVIWGLFWLLLAAWLEVRQSVPYEWRSAGLLIAAAALILALQQAGRWLRWPRGAQAMAVLTALLGVVLTVLLALFRSPVEYGAWLGWPLWYAGIGWALYCQDRHDPSFIGLKAAHAVLLVSAVLVIGTGLDKDLGAAFGGVWRGLGIGLAAVILAVLVLWPRGERYWPLAQRRDDYLQQGMTGLAFFGLLWLLLMSLLSDGNPRIFPYLPVLNPLDLVALLLLGSLYCWQRRTARLGLWPGGRLPAAALLAAVAFLWLSTSVIRALHYGMGTPLGWPAVLHSVQVQAALSVLWALLGFAAMILGTRRARRLLWLCGAALMAVVVLKLFVVDLEGSGTLARIVSFASTGALLLATGYFSPLPPPA